MSAPTLGLTTSQTIGPFFEDALLREDAVRNVLAGPETEGERIRIEGRVIDGDGAPTPDAMVEIWQANAHGRYHHPADARDVPVDPSFTGFGRSGTDEEGRFWFETVRPGRVPFEGDTWQAPHILVTVFAAGLLRRVITRIYFPDEPSNEADPVLATVEDASARETLFARPEPGDPPRYGFDIVLRGEGETAFFVD